MSEPIMGFQGPYRFLSNFWPSTITVSGIDYPTVEHAFQAAKSLDPGTRRQIASLPTPGQAKRAGHALTLPVDWDGVRVDIMRILIEAKFSPLHPNLVAQLIATGDRKLVEANDWGDHFWGTDLDGNGTNMLGQLLMEQRAALTGKPAPKRPATGHVHPNYTKPPEGVAFILVTGDREWADPSTIANALNLYPGWPVMHGTARGADTLAGQVAVAQGRDVYPWPAPWDRYGRSAGPRRNIAMLDCRPSVVLVFHDDLERSKGTRHCHDHALQRGYPVRRFTSLPTLEI